MDGDPQFKKMRNTFMIFLKTERLYINQVGTTVDHNYEQVVAFINSCYTDEFGQVRQEIVDSITRNTELLVSLADINVQFINIRLPGHINQKAYTPLQACMVPARKGIQGKIKRVLLNSPHPDCSISQPATKTYEPFEVSNDPESTTQDWNQRLMNLLEAYKNRV